MLDFLRKIRNERTFEKRGILILSGKVGWSDHSCGSSAGIVVVELIRFHPN